MQIGWIDFSKTERNKVLNVLELLSESAALDELGIAPIRDAFSNRFFPGTSTLQTRAKYYFCVPYAFKDIELSYETNQKKIISTLDSIEKSCAQIFLKNEPKADRIIGSRALRAGTWVKRAPSDIYWAGLRRLGIFSAENMSVSQYINYLSDKNRQKNELRILGSRKDNAEENECDDIDAGNPLYRRFWNIPTYRKNWKENLTIKLTHDEAVFLRRQIIKTCEGSMFQFILKNNITEITDLNGFEDFESSLINLFDENIQSDYMSARSFSDFIYVLRVLFNIIVSDNKNETANEEWNNIEANLEEYADIDIDDIFKRLSLSGYVPLRRFLIQSQEYMQKRDIEQLKKCIISREVHLKGSARAKTMHPGELDPAIWFGGGLLDYRFNNAKIIIKDIFEGVDNNAESAQ